MYILGIHIGHDAGAALVREGRVVAAVNEERFNKIKHYAELPWASVRYCLKEAGIDSTEVDVVAVPTVLKVPELEFLFGLKGHPITRKRTAQAVTFFRSILGRSNHALPTYRQPFRLGPNTEIVQVEHHLAHAASAYYTSGFDDKTLIVTTDGIGDGVSTAVWQGEKGKITPLVKSGAEGSLGWFYGAVTEGLGWWVGDGEGKTMGLAPYGDHRKANGVLDSLLPRYQNGELVRPHDFGPPGYWLEAGTYQWHLQDSEPVRELILRHGREHIAAEAQRLLEEEMLSLIFSWLERERTAYLACAGGVFLNVKLNQRVWESGRLKGQHIFPAAGDGGLPVGAALYVWHQATAETHIQAMQDVYWGPGYSQDEIEDVLRVRNIPYRRVDDIAATTAGLLAHGQIVGWMQGRMEYGPRALGARSILMDPRRAENKDIINASVKYREPFRPFCPSMLAEAVDEYLVKGRPEPYMITSFNVPPDKAQEIPAVVHVDGTARPQTVDRETNSRYWRLIKRFGEITGVPVILNTSFNIKGDPIICTPADAVRCFFDTGMHVLVIGDFLVQKG